MHKRMVSLFSCLVLLFSVCIYRIYYVGASDYLATAAQVQGRYTLEVAHSRGGIYDRNFQLLVNNSYRYVASVLPTPQAASELLRVMPEEERESVVGRLAGGLPFVLEVPTNDIYAVGIDVFKVPNRYGDVQLAPHLIGYLGDGGRKGVSGIERAYDGLLDQAGATFQAKYQVDATGRTMEGGGVEIFRTNEDAVGGVVLTLDRDLQLLTQDALAQGCKKGAAVVLDVATGEILAMASLPAFDQNDIAASLDSTDAPFINRALSAYNIGSVFKLAVASAALESGFSPSYTYVCQGAIDVKGQIFRCNNHAVHGTLTMGKSLEVSCNTYFINLAQKLDPGLLLAVCRHLGLGESVELAPGLTTQPGNLPSLKELSSPAALANFSFGQGSSLATPLQIARIVAAIANDGATVTPSLVRGFTLDGKTFSERAPSYASSQVLSPKTARQIQELMIGVVEEGSGRTARPMVGSAGGKTSSAQTGIMVGEGENAKEIVHAWFAGFYPSQQPRYSIVVFVEGGESGERVAAPIFKQIADGISAKEAALQEASVSSQ
ncbi:MAG TPA: penicillin-binding protein 2 [Clostridiales bacterium]|nr:penicillin-binding protein 2 [Clostridiales bacterium]